MAIYINPMDPLVILIAVVLMLMVIIIAMLGILFRILRSQGALLKFYLTEEVIHADAERADITFPKIVAQTQPQGFYEMLRAEGLSKARNSEPH